MPSLSRFLFTTGLIAGAALGALWVLATYFEPETRETSHTLVGVEIEKP